MSKSKNATTKPWIFPQLGRDFFILKEFVMYIFIYKKVKNKTKNYINTN